MFTVREFSPTHYAVYETTIETSDKCEAARKLLELFGMSDDIFQHFVVLGELNNRGDVILNFDDGGTATMTYSPRHVA